MRRIGALSTTTGHQSSRCPAQHSVKVVSTVGNGIRDTLLALGQAVSYLLVLLRFVSQESSTGQF